MLCDINVPPRLHNFVLGAPWRKLPVAVRMFAFHMTPTGVCPLCQVTEDHAHMLNKCPYLSPPYSPIQRLWGGGDCRQQLAGAIAGRH